MPNFSSFVPYNDTFCLLCHFLFVFANKLTFRLTRIVFRYHILPFKGIVY